MEWNAPSSERSPEFDAISNLEAKSRVANEAAGRLRDGDVVGVGSGSTSLLALHALVERSRQEGSRFRAITTSLEITMACNEWGVATTTLLDARPDWSFDGADEVDPEGNMIKGRGGAMLREKILLASSPERYILIDESKRVDQLGDHALVPVEVVPEAVRLVESLLASELGAREVALRRALAKDGPVITERGNVILEVRFTEITRDTNARVDSLPGVAASGLFFDFHPTVLCA
ncbi:MAG TPA: ribose 5-phosphate isomerase A [Acidimicrobiales bacterium]|jgi:ribose 5-phosphate isomerase A